jgi:hypothetical protein
MVKMWTHDPDSPTFRYEDVAHWFEGASVNKIFEVINDPQMTEFKQLQIIRDEDGGFDAFLAPDGVAFAVLIDEAKVTWDATSSLAQKNTKKERNRESYDFFKQPKHIDLNKNPEFFEWIVAPVFYEDDEYLLPNNGHLWNPIWVGQTIQDFFIIRAPRKTDFFEKTGYWPYYNKEPVTLAFEIKVDNKIVSIFRYDNISYVAWFREDEPPLWVKKKKKFPGVIRDSQTNYLFGNTELEQSNIANKYFEEKYGENFPTYDVYGHDQYVLDTPLLRTLETCQSVMIPPVNTPIPVMQIPVDIRIGSEYNSGDLGSILVFWDGQDKFICEYWQT